MSEITPRRKVVNRDIDPLAEHLIFFLQQTEEISCSSSESSSDSDSGSDSGDDSSGMIMTGVTAEGISVAVKVLGWTIPVYVMPSPRLLSADPSSSILLRFVEEFFEHSPGISPSISVVHAPRAYGYVPDPSKCNERLKIPFIRLRFANSKEMRWACKQLGDVFASGNLGKQASRSGVLRSSVSLVAGNASIEEGDRLRSEFKFLDEKEITPSSWVVLPRTKWEMEDGQAFSYRTWNVVVDEKHVWSLEKLLGNDHLREVLHKGVRPRSALPESDSVPPSLYAYCDIEARSHDRNEFPDPTQPSAPCYMVGMSFVWAFAVPPMFAKEPDPESRSRRTEEAKLRWQNARIQKRLEFQQQREERQRRRVERHERIRSKRKEMREMIEGVLEGVDVNSDDESEGEAGFAKVELDLGARERGEMELISAEEISVPYPVHLTPCPSPPIVPFRPFLRVLLVLGETDPIPGVVVVTCESEKELLESIPKILFEIMDVDGIRGYNWIGFDTRYIVKRAELHNISSTALRWSHLVRRPPSYDRSEVMLSLQRGLFRMVRMHYTNTVDMMVYMRQQLDLSSYKLEAIAQNFGLEGKHPVTPDDIYLAYEGTPAERARVGAYCVRDCDVLVDIARASQFEITILQFSRIMITPPELMWTSGQQIRVIHQLIWQAHRNGFIVDGLFVNRNAEDKALVALGSGKNFSGGFVMKPVVGHHRTPTATLDYKSLYPSIMISHKLCYSTALLHPYDSPEWIARIERSGLEVVQIATESGKFAYVQHPVNLIPDMEWKLWVSRQKIKKEMKRVAGDPLMYAVLDAKQLAVKVSMNSTFGVTGAEFAMLGMKRIAASITHVGRVTVQGSRDFADSLRGADLPEVEPGVPILKPDAKLKTVYGDTDSIMVNLPDAITPQFEEWARAKVLAEGEGGGPGCRAAILLLACRSMGDFITENLNKRYRPPMEIEFEEVASEAIFLKPKMYTKNVIEDVGDETVAKLARGIRVGKLKVAGIAAKRRDRSALTKRLQKGVAMSIIHKGDDARALQLVRRWVTRLVLYEINMEDFMITTELKNPMERPGFSVQPWVAVAWAMEKACRGSEPIRGERVPWIIVRDKDLSRTTPPPSKQITLKEIELPHDPVTVGKLVALVNAVRCPAPAAPALAPALAPAAPARCITFGSMELTNMPESTLLRSIGLESGHKLHDNAGSFRISWNSDGGMEEEEEGGGDESEEDSSAGSRSALAGLMFRARELTPAERQNLGKKRVASDSLSPYARHPTEIRDIRDIDVENYLGHIVQALSILLQEARPDLWDQMKQTIARARPLIAYSLGKPIQKSLLGFFTSQR